MNITLLFQIYDAIAAGNVRHVAGRDVSHTYVGPITLRESHTPKYTSMLSINSNREIPWTTFRSVPAAINEKWIVIPTDAAKDNTTNQTICQAEFNMLLDATSRLFSKSTFNIVPDAALPRAQATMSASEKKLSQYLAGLLEKSK